MITVSRMALTPFIVNSILNQDLSTALGLTAIAGVTDVLDGFIARNVPHQKSNIGSLLDPLADKVLVTSLVLSLTVMKLFPISLTCLFILRDVGLIAVVFAAFLRYSLSASPVTFTREVEIKASNISKLNTLCQLSSVIFSMTYPLYGFPSYEYLQAVWLLSAGTTIASGFGYLQSLPEWRRRIAQISHKKQP
uniref:cardiolipin synthase (CMP-forming) n=1 Tax=Trichobilharzia regenti TaxID=157069 RepID=A0AA85J671_TRIRE|nr:unnamed protein product [Trichobilharzia regenti]